MYKKSVIKSVRQPTKNVYYVAGYINKELAEKITIHKEQTGCTTAELIRSALELFLEKN